tara:strand:- start:4531 stop:7344 length:2814 start_codon:yes stop_codon:yes gene_type:complete
MAKRPYTKNGIAGVSGRNLNSVRNALDVSGLYPLRMNLGGTPETRLQEEIAFITGQAPSGVPTLEEVQQRKDFYDSYIGGIDYEADRKEDKDYAQLQAALALAQAGFNWAGATPQVGETGISTMGRAFGAPLAGRLGEIASTFSEQEAARKAARRADERQIKLKALQDVEEDKKAKKEAYLTQRADAIQTLRSGISILQNQELVKADGSVEYVGEVKRVATGPLFDQIKYFDAQGNELIGALRDKKDPSKGHKATTNVNFDDFGRIFTLDDGTVEVRQEPIIITTDFNPDGSVFKRTTEFTDGTPVYFAGGIKPSGIEVPNAQRIDKKTEASTGSLQAKDYNLIDKGGKPYVFPNTNTPAVVKILSSGVDQGRLAEVGTGRLVPTKIAEQYELQEITSEQPPSEKGLDDPTFEAQFQGFIGSLGSIQSSADLGKTGLRFVPTEGNYELDPTKDKFPFVRVDGKPLSQEDKERLSLSMKTQYFSGLKSIKTGESELDLNVQIGERFLNRSLDNWGLSPYQARENISEARPRETITNPEAITNSYVNASTDFQKNPVAADTLVNLPFPVNTKNLKSGTGRLVLFEDLGVNFGSDTTSPPAVGKDMTLVNRTNAIQNLDRGAIEERILAESLSNSVSPLGTALGGTKSLTDRKRVVGEALKDKREQIAEQLSTEKNREFAQELRIQLQAIALLEKINVAATLSGVQGFIRGDVEGFFIKKFGGSAINYFRDGKGKEAARQFVALKGILDQLVSRQLLEAVGEERKSNSDVSGMQKILPKLGNAEKFEAEKLRQLLTFMKNNVAHSLKEIGTYDLEDSDFQLAASLGFDLKGIKPKNDYYNPYLNMGKYAVTKQDIPAYSEEHQSALRDTAIFEFLNVARDDQKPSYEFIIVNDKGLPIRNKDTEEAETILLTKEDFKNPMYQNILDFNRAKLFKLRQAVK